MIINTSMKNINDSYKHSQEEVVDVFWAASGECDKNLVRQRDSNWQKLSTTVDDEYADIKECENKSIGDPNGPTCDKCNRLIGDILGSNIPNQALLNMAE